jgi:glutamyl-Q tRNA(Asp) synthetase
VARPKGPAYIGRFAPSPTGELHLGSLYTAAASYLDARANQGRWLVRLEDIDRPRVVPGSAAQILHTLEQFGFEWDGPPACQSDRASLYEAALDSLHTRGLTFDCSCSRSELADEDRYPGTCRDGPRRALSTAVRLRTDTAVIQFSDRIQGVFRQDVADAVGDFVLRRRDQLIAYVLAVVVDDGDQRVTHVVRGADLLDNTPRQIYLQERLGLPRPVYAHVPLLLEADGKKLAKSARSVRLQTRSAVEQLSAVFDLLGLPATRTADAASLAELWRWGIAQWKIDGIPRRLSCKLST